MRTPIEPISYRPADAAAVLGLSRRTLTRLIAEGRVVARRAGARTLIDAASVKTYFESLPAIDGPRPVGSLKPGKAVQ
jgi:excisionase family DNA binding protein